MKKNYSIIKTMVVLMILVAGKIGAQCTNAAAFGTAAAPAQGGSVTVTTCMYAGEYATLNTIVVGNTYSTTSSVVGDFITIHSGTPNGPVVAFGTTPLNWVATTAGTHYAHVNTNSACGTLNTCHTMVLGCYPAGIPNDLCANPFVASAPGMFPGTTIGSTVESPVPPTCNTAVQAQGGVWYTLVGNGNKLGVDLTCASSWDSKIFVFTGACGAFTCVTGNDDFGPICASSAAASATWCSQVGVLYRILVQGYSSASAYVLNVTQTVVAAGVTPTITASQNPICAGKNSTVTATGSTAFNWNPGALTGTVQTLSPAATTIYTVNGIDATTGCPNSTALLTLNVNPNPTVAVTSGSLCSGNSFTMVASGAATYTFSSGSAVVTPSANAAYTVTGASAAGCTNTAVSNVTVSASPTVSVAGGAICAGNSFTLSPSGATSYTYSTGPVVTPTANASYTITGTTGACSSNAVASVTVNAAPTVVVAGGAICAGNSFTLSPSGATSYTYSTGPVVTPTANASYTVTGTTAGCSSNAVASVTVNATPTVVVAGGAICAGGSFTLNPTGATSYTYSTGPVVTPTANASYTVTGTTAGCSGNAVASVTVNSNPTVTAVSSTSLLCDGQTASLTANGASTYSWNTSSTNTVITITPSVTTSYTVTGTDANTCLNSFVITQSVTTCTGLNNNVASTIGVLVYPNPNTGLFTVELNNGTTKTIEVMDVTGRIVLANTTSNNKVDFNINTLANGVYYVRIQSNNSIEVVKIVKQ